MTAHNEPCQAVGASFIPMVVESLGGWSLPSAELAVTWVRGPAHPQEKPSLANQPEYSIYYGLLARLGETTRQLFQRLAITLWRGNQACGSTLCPPPLPGLMETLEFFVFLVVSGVRTHI